MEPLSGKAALITGGSRGIGRAIVEELAANGADVAINYVRSASEAGELAENVQARGRRAIALQANVGVEEEARGMVERAAAELGRLDFLVNNAGISRDHAIQNMTGEEWRAVVDVNVNGVFYCTSARDPAHDRGRRRQDHQHSLRPGSVVEHRAGQLRHDQGRHRRLYPYGGHGTEPV